MSIEAEIYLPLTPRVAQAHGLTVWARCEHCGFSRSPLAGPPPPAPDRDLVAALHRGKLRCMKCHRPAERLEVRRYVVGGYLQLITAWRSGRVQLHDDPPVNTKVDRR